MEGTFTLKDTSLYMDHAPQIADKTAERVKQADSDISAMPAHAKHSTRQMSWPWPETWLRSRTCTKRRSRHKQQPDRNGWPTSGGRISSGLRWLLATWPTTTQYTLDPLKTSFHWLTESGFWAHWGGVGPGSRTVCALYFKMSAVMICIKFVRSIPILQNRTWPMHLSVHQQYFHLKLEDVQVCSRS